MPKLSATGRKGDDAKFKSAKEALIHENKLIDAKTARLRAARLAKAAGEKYGPNLPTPESYANSREDDEE